MSSSTVAPARGGAHNAPPPISFDNSFARDLPAAGVRWKPAAVPEPRLVFFNAELAAELKLDAAWGRPDAAAYWAGAALPEGAQPFAQAYAGHQFGGFSPQLGDGRALLLGEVLDAQGQRRDIAFKGSGRTPFSRGGDGKAALGPMLREVLIGEALHALGIPSTRALAVAATGEPVYREQVLPGAVLTRVAASHLRVGSFQYFAARGDLDGLRALAEYAIARHDLALVGDADRYLKFFEAVAQRQARLIAQWMNIGFVHGVMNTDNMTISGESIDFGPCAFIDAYDPAAVFSSIDTQGRYAFGNQPSIARWNLARLAEALLPLTVDTPDDEAGVKQGVARATAIIDAFPAQFEAAWRAGQTKKLGLSAGEPGRPSEEDIAIADAWLALLQSAGVDFTQANARLADAAQGHPQPLSALFEPQQQRPALLRWLQRWQARCEHLDAQAAGAGSEGSATAESLQAARAQAMRAANPQVIPRNHRVEEALAAAGGGDLGPFERLLAALRRPFDPSPEQAAAYGEPAPPQFNAGFRTFCGT